MRWTSDGRLLFIGDMRGESFVFETNVESGETRRIGEGGSELQSIAFNSDASFAVVGVKSPDSAGDLYRMSLADGATSPLTAVNAAYFIEHPHCEYREVHDQPRRS